MSTHPETYSALVETLYQARLENRRLRISQLRRMREGAFVLWNRLHPTIRTMRNARRMDAFRAACLAEIERLRGEG